MVTTEKQINSKFYSLITGAGSGIGQCFAYGLAKRGHNLFLVSLPGEDLHETAEKISKAYNIHVCYMELDLTHSENIDKICMEINKQKIIIEILINNAGMGSGIPFLEMENSYYTKQICLNVWVPVALTHRLLPIMMKSSRAYVMNVASLAAYIPMSNREIYGATKAFLVSFSKSMQETLKGTTVQMTLLCLGPVNSNAKMIELHRGLSWFSRKMVMEPSEVAEIGLNALFLSKKMCIPGFL